MKKIIFDINKKPLLDSDGVAYLVDSKNVNIMRQYIVQYYSQCYCVSDEGRTYVDWFDEIIITKLKQHPDNSYFIYFSPKRLSWDENQPYVDANQTYYTRYYIYQKALIQVE